ncbi:MAG: hypothetical protein JXR49_16175 [Acidobacteria bacterium]|nr:hypothetical protein [Acidobacteriota bacterium]
MSVSGTGDLQRHLYRSSDIVLICHTDLLDSASPKDIEETGYNPASFLAKQYKQKGDNFVRDLHGWFGIILYDLEQEALKAWTDHFGIRRLVYKNTEDALGIASDLRILNGFFPEQPEIDPVAILEYLQYTCIPAPRTIYKNTERLPPGHILTSTPKTSSRKYWNIRYREDRKRSLNKWTTETFDMIKSSVGLTTKHVDSPEQLGCFLSGGTDSSSISGLVGNITGQKPKTFSIGFEDPRYNEIEYARIAARHFKANHHEYFVTPDNVIDLLKKAYTVYDEPFGNSSIVPAYYCALSGVKNGVSHMIAGDGGDEIFGGNQRYANDRLFQRYFLIPKTIRSYILEPFVKSWDSLKNSDNISLVQRYIRRASIPVPDRYFSYDFLSSVNVPELFIPDFYNALNGADPLAAARRHFKNTDAGCDLNRWLFLDLAITITDNDLRKVTPMTELAGAVPRYPLLDHSLVEFSATIPANLKVRGRRLRYLFKECMRGFLPQETIKKQKHGFGLPFSVWLGENKTLRDFTFDTLGSNDARQRGYFRKDLLEWLWQQYNSESQVFYGDVLWIFLMLERWHITTGR